MTPVIIPIFIRCGPLLHIWCMTYEAKHAYFKHLVRITGNFKNILKTLSLRHQRYVCFHLVEPDSFLGHCDYIGKGIYRSIMYNTYNYSQFIIGTEIRIESLDESSDILESCQNFTNDQKVHKYA